VKQYSTRPEKYSLIYGNHFFNPHKIGFFLKPVWRPFPEKRKQQKEREIKGRLKRLEKLVKRIKTYWKKSLY
jgi:hypothetical protein